LVDSMERAMRQGQAWWARYRIRAPVLVPTDLAGLVFAGVTKELPSAKPPAGTGLTLTLRVMPVDWERQERLIVRQERAPGIRPTLAQVPDLLEERAVPLLGTTATLRVGGAHPVGRIRFDGDRVLPHVPMSRLLWAQGGIAYLVCAWGLPEATLLRVTASLRPLGPAPAAR
jgi:hypothetical protein